jgi:hypothetical protein
LLSKLKLKQQNLTFDAKNRGISIYLYKHINNKIIKKYIKYESINILSKIIKISRITIKNYLNTNVPYNNYLFYTEPLKEFNNINELVNESKKELNLKNILPKKVFVYNCKAEILNFDSIESVAKFLNVSSSIIRIHIDKLIKGGINGHFLFSKILNNLDKNKLIKFAKLRKTNNLKVWVYDANNFNFNLGKFKSLQKAADNLNLDYRTIVIHLDTNKVTLKNGKLLLFFSKEFTLEEFNSIKFKNFKNETIKLWVYKKVDNNLILINDRNPTFNSKYLASKELKISHKTINKYLDKKIFYKGYIFQSIKL